MAREGSSRGQAATILLAVLIAACTKESPPAEPDQPDTPAPAPVPAPGDKPAVLAATDVVFDGARLGDSYAKLLARPPYDKPCDDDPVDRARSTRAMVYGGNECRGNRFADGTTVLIFIPYEDPDVFDKPIRAIAWLGGRYFDGRSNLGLKVGATREAVRARLGAPVSTLALPDRLSLVVERHAGDIFAIYDGDVAAGYAAGELPAELREGDEHWRAVAQMYRRYTNRVGSASGAAPQITRADCDKLLDHAIGLMKADPDRAGEVDELVKHRDEALDQCARKLTPDGLRCGMAAATYAAFRACQDK